MPCHQITDNPDIDICTCGYFEMCTTCDMKRRTTMKEKIREQCKIDRMGKHVERHLIQLIDSTRATDGSELCDVCWTYSYVEPPCSKNDSFDGLVSAYEQNIVSYNLTLPPDEECEEEEIKSNEEDKNEIEEEEDEDDEDKKYEIEPLNIEDMTFGVIDPGLFYGGNSNPVSMDLTVPPNNVIPDNIFDESYANHYLEYFGINI